VSKIFLSCGQKEKELGVADKIAAALRADPYCFEVYVARDVQSIFEINSGILKELKDSDYYLFVNFRRGQPQSKNQKMPGSVFSNQEFAMAYALGFERMLVVNQFGVSRERILRYFGCNTYQFKGQHDCLSSVMQAWDRTGWKSDYSRRLSPGQIRFSEVINYLSGHIHLKGQMLYLDIHNGRSDAALETTGRLWRLRRAGAGEWIQSPILSELKATGKPSF
jgi:hypothetical protein